MGLRGRDWVLGHFNAPAVAAQTLRLYGEIAGRDKRAGFGAAVTTKLVQFERFDREFRSFLSTRRQEPR